jgi:cation transport regulator ChaB
MGHGESAVSAAYHRESGSMVPTSDVGGAMPKTTRSGKPRQSELPETLQRSPAKAQRTFAKTHDSAAEQYGEGERAHRTAYAALKHGYERVGDRWEPKDEPGPSDPRSKRPTQEKREGKGDTFGGVDAEGNTKEELYERARRLGIEGRSRMSKRELAKAIAKKQ